MHLDHFGYQSAGAFNLCLEVTSICHVFSHKRHPRNKFVCAIGTEMCVCFGKGKVKVCAAIGIEAGPLQVSFVSKEVHFTAWKPSMRMTLLV